jgi:SAM-dependent methyltransferase
LLVTPPVAAQVAALAEILSRRGVGAGAKILDAGCGTGRYALELAGRGFRVAGLDLSASLLAEARRRAREAAAPVALARGNILALPFAPRLDAVLCRGVLNDLLDDRSRQKVFESFAGSLRRGGVLVFDVREWEGTARRKRLAPVSLKTLDTPRGRLTFRSETRLDEARRELLVAERHALADGAEVRTAVHEFTMRCWTREELREGLTRAGFARLDYLGGYDLAARAGESDRLVCVASRE